LAAAAKKAAGGGASAKAASKGAAAGSKDERWVQGQLSALEAQREAAVARGDTWCEEAHEWHEDRLSQLLDLLKAGTVTSLPDEVREGVEFYVSQLADGGEVSQESFYDDREIYGDLLEVASKEEAPYARPLESPEAAEAIEKLRAWTDASQQGMDRLSRLWKQHPDSAGAAEAVMAKIASLAADHKDDQVSGLAPKAMMVFVAEAMQRFPRDVGVQVQGSSAILSLARHSGDNGTFTVLQCGGAKLWAEALKNNIQDTEVALATTRAFSYMTGPKGVQQHTPEWAFLCESGAEQVLNDCLRYHTNEQRIDKAARTSIPFLRG